MTKQVRFVEVAALPESDERLLVALLNTTPIVAGERRDELAEESSVRAWLATTVEDAPENTDFSHLRETRVALRRVVVVGEAAPTVLSDALAGVQATPTLTDDGITWALHAPARMVVAARAVLDWDWMRANLPRTALPRPAPRRRSRSANTYSAWPGSPSSLVPRRCGCRMRR